MHIRFIYNEKSGREASEKKLNRVIRYLLEDGHTISMRFTKKRFDATEFAREAACDKTVDRLVSVGGDGTANEVVTGLIESNSKLPLIIMPEGTVNDFAKYMGLNKNEWDTFDTIINGKVIDVDCGKCNDKYFINVGSIGVFTEVAHNTSTALKSALGRTAYVLNALKDITPEKLKPISFRFESKEYNNEQRAYLFLISNSKSIGGFHNMAPDASVSDGLLDCIIMSDMAITDMVSCFIKIRNGEHVNHPKVVYFKTREIKVSSIQPAEVDIDGELYGELPVTFSVVPEAIRLLV